MTKARAALYILGAFDSTLPEPFRAALNVLLLHGMEEVEASQALSGFYEYIDQAWGNLVSAEETMEAWLNDRDPPCVRYDATSIGLARTAIREAEHGSLQWYLLSEVISGYTNYASWKVLRDVAHARAGFPKYDAPRERETRLGSEFEAGIGSEYALAAHKLTAADDAFEGPVAFLKKTALSAR